ncbi:MAG: lysophospholipid acyltransferase family protein [Candidatus Aminicenantales bacterium]
MRLRSEFGWKMVGALGRLLLRFVALSSRVEIIGKENLLTLRNQCQPIIHLVWHGRIFLAPYFFRKQGIMPLISPSEDGEVVARIVEGWGYKTLRGSSSHSMVSAWKEMLKELKEGGEVLIVPDGPRGPGRVLKLGAIKLAIETGAALVPFSFSASRRRFLRSWDRFLLALPFSRIVAVYGKPILLPPNLGEEDLEDLRHQVEKALNLVEEEADRLLGQKF